MKAAVAVFVPDNEDLKTETVTWDKEKRFTVMKGSVFQEDIIITNVDISKCKASKYMKIKVIEWKWERDQSKVMAGDF